MSQGGVNAQNIPLPVPLSLGGSGQVLTASPINTIKVTRVTATGAGTYTPTTGMQFVVVRAQGAGGGAGGAATSASNQAAIGAAGGGGGYVEALFTAAQVGASKAYSVGAKGTGGAAGNNAGTDGGDTTFNTTWIVAGGGKQGNGGAANSTTLTQFFGSGGAGGGVSVSTGVVMMLIPGEKTDTSGMNLGTLQTRNAVGGAAGSGYPGGEFSINSTGAATAGSSAAANSGAGGSAGQTMVASQVAGGDGGDGWIEFIEYITQ